MAGDGAAEAEVAVVTVKRGCAKKGRNQKLVLQDLSVRRVSPACSSSKPLQPRRRRSVAIPCCRSPRSAAEWGSIVLRVERRTRKKMAGDGAAEAEVAVVTVKRGCAKKRTETGNLSYKTCL